MKAKLTRKKAQEIIVNFIQRYDGKTIYVKKLNNDELFEFILTEAYLYFDRENGVGADISTALDNAIEVAEGHRRDGYVQYKRICINDSIMLTNGGL